MDTPERDDAAMTPDEAKAAEPVETPAEAAAPEAEPAAEPAAEAPAPKPAPAPAKLSPLAEPPEVPIDVPERALTAQSRRDFLLFAAGLVATSVFGWWALPDRTQKRLLPDGHDALDTLAARVGLTKARREKTLNRALTFDDDVAEAIYSKDRRVRTYAKSEVTPLRNNYDGRTPSPEFIPNWRLTLGGLASGRMEHLSLNDLSARFATHEQVTRFVCVEGWSAVAWWGGIRFADLLAAFPPAPGARWAAIRSAVNLDSHGNPDPYYISLDLGTAMHPQALLATQYSGAPLPIEHGAPLRLLVPMKLGLKNIKAITDITYTAKEPADFWNERGYSKYDGL